MASQIGGFLDLVDNDRNGFLVDVQDEAGFSHKMRKLISDPNLLLQYRKGSLSKAGQFDIHKITSEYEAILEDAAHES